MLTKRFLLTGFAALAGMTSLARAAAAAAPGFTHRVLMRGSVVQSEGGTVTVCIGKAEGAETGQVYRAYRNTVKNTGGGRGPGPSFVRSEIGTVRINAVVDDHFANATQVSGDVRVNDIVELESTVGCT